MKFKVQHGGVVWEEQHYPHPAVPVPGVGWVCADGILHGREEFFCSTCKQERPIETTVEYASEEVTKPDWQRAANKFQKARPKQQRNTNVEKVQKGVVSKVRTTARTSTTKGRGAVSTRNRTTRRSS